MKAWAGFAALVAVGCVSTGPKKEADKGKAKESVVTTDPIEAPNEPVPRGLHTALWTGEGMLVWGGMLGKGDASYSTGGGIYYPGSGKWFDLPREVQQSRYHHSAVWTGLQMIVWGGIIEKDESRANTGHMLDMEDDKWFPVTSEKAPVARAGHTAVWTGERMIVWGGEGADEFFADGGLYDLEKDAWETLPPDGAPEVRAFHSAIWTGSKMIVWGGLNSDGARNNGGIYDPKTKTWKPMALDKAPQGRFSHTAVWTGKHMIVWGGRSADTTYLNDGAVYDPANDTWTPIATKGAPAARELHTAAWTGKEMVIWGGHDGREPFAGGASYDPKKKTWATLKPKTKGVSRYMHGAVWTGDQLLVWGGKSSGGKFVKRKQGLLVQIKGGAKPAAAPAAAAAAAKSESVAATAGKKDRSRVKVKLDD